MLAVIESDCRWPERNSKDAHRGVLMWRTHTHITLLIEYILQSLSINADHEQPVEQLEMFYFNATTNQRLAVSLILQTSVCDSHQTAWRLRESGVRGRGHSSCFMSSGQMQMNCCYKTSESSASALSSSVAKCILSPKCCTKWVSHTHCFVGLLILNMHGDDLCVTVILMSPSSLGHLNTGDA